MGLVMYFSWRYLSSPCYPLGIKLFRDWSLPFLPSQASSFERSYLGLIQPSVDLKTIIFGIDSTKRVL